MKNLREECCFFHEVRYPPEQLTPAQHWVLALDSGLNQKLLSISLSISISNSCSLSLSPSFPISPYESCCPKISWGDPWENISTRRAVQVYTQYFPSIFQSSMQHTIGCPEELLCRFRDILTQAILPPIFPLSSLHGEQLTTTCELLFTWIPNLTHISKYFQKHS